LGKRKGPTLATAGYLASAALGPFEHPISKLLQWGEEPMELPSDEMNQNDGRQLLLRGMNGAQLPDVRKEMGLQAIHC